MIIVYLLILLSFIYIFNHFRVKYGEFKKAFFFVLSLYILIILTILMLSSPQVALDAGLVGVDIWLNIILPSLFPFFVCSEILIGLGIADFLGSLLEPIIRPIYNVPGQSAYVFSISVASGYPVGAKTVADLLDARKIDTISGQKILSFSSTSGPLFLIGSVSIGMLKNPSIGSLLAISHYVGALLTGLLFKHYYDYKYKRRYDKNSISKVNLHDSLNILYNRNKKNKKSIGELLSSSVVKSMNSILMIGGFVIVYSIIIKLLSDTTLFTALSTGLNYIFPSVSKELFNGLLCGLIEMTNGCKIIATTSGVSYVMKLCMVSFIISWSGLSIHSQVISVIKNTKLKIKPYLACKLCHGFISAFLTLILYNAFYYKNNYVETFSYDTSLSLLPNNFLAVFAFSMKIFGVIIATLFVLGLLYNQINKK
ncbi:sporulation integral membrane protein YlbJ [Clostridiaceae bacterium M8S5]|nr:sporulation integral membrane protein YlbJ [Clostridiaceae bacterium M8S5]